ncbi:MAG TPA: hypothetical protein VMS18_20210 [Candidatus Binatia bacterium]|nr:hypothetical protein [Candidatus Binatia bacterium]
MIRLLSLHRLIANCGLAVLVIASAGSLACGGEHNGQTSPKQHTVALSWNPSSTSNVQYNVYRGTQHLGPYTTKLNSTPLPSTSFTDSTVQNGATYYYVVTAVDQQSESDYSNEAQIVIPTS